MTNLPEAGDRVIDPSTGERHTVKWVAHGHIQFHGGRSCRAKDFSMFYSEHDVERGEETKTWFSGDDRQ